MEPDATLTGAGWPRHRPLPGFLLVAALIIGLFGMHILGVSPPGTNMTAPHAPTSDTLAVTVTAAGQTADHDMAAAAGLAPPGMPVGVASAGADDAACRGHCGDPMPHHPAMMCCELALSIGGTAGSNPGPLALPGEPVAVAGHVRSVLVVAMEPIPPPSLIVLSISRT